MTTSRGQGLPRPLDRIAEVFWSWAAVAAVVGPFASAIIRWLQ